MRRNAVIALLCVAMSACLEAALFFDISTGNDLHVLKAGEEDQLAIYAFNGTLESVTTNVTFQITDINNNVVESKTVPVLITAQEDILIPLKAPAKFGPYILRCLEGEGDVRQQPPIRFVYMKPAGPRPKKDVSGKVLSIGGAVTVRENVKALEIAIDRGGSGSTVYFDAEECELRFRVGDALKMSVARNFICEYEVAGDEKEV